MNAGIGAGDAVRAGRCLRREALVAAAAIALLAAGPGASPGAAQQVRVSGVTSLRYLDLHPLVEDSVPVSESLGDGLLRRTADGLLVRCVTGMEFCRYHRTGPREGLAPLAQDLRVSGWGFGQGIRVYAHVRARAALGGEDFWPESDDAFDALVAYAELDRGPLRIRAGRDWKVSGLGYYNYDGASVRYRPWSRLDVEAWGGLSLLRGANEGLGTGALEAVEGLAPEERAVLVGGRVAFRPDPGLAVSATYQRELRRDRSGLYSERGAMDAVLRRNRWRATASLETDLVGRTVNEALLDVRATARPDLALGVFARRYRPFFELWTIWGAFSPTGFEEVGATASWSPPGRPLRLDVQGSWRTYGDDGAGSTFGAFRSDGWRLGAAASGPLGPDWTLRGGYHADIGFGAALSEGTLTLRRELGEGAWLSGNLAAFQRAREFRVAQGTVVGAGLDGGFRVDARTRVSGSATLYRHTSPDAATVDWSQIRAGLRVEWTVGREPGLRGGSGGGS